STSSSRSSWTPRSSRTGPFPAGMGATSATRGESRRVNRRSPASSRRHSWINEELADWCVRQPTQARPLTKEKRFMTQRLASLILCGGVAVLGSACATKSFVQKQVSATESKLTQQMTATETNLAERAAL